MTSTQAESGKPGPIRWGIVGPGRIADKVAADFAHTPAGILVGVGSRSQQRADEFAHRHNVDRAYGSYRALLVDPDIDAIYLATPHPQHAAIAIGAVEAGKAVLVEKAFTATAAGAEQVISAAHRTGVFVMEAMWTRFQPAIVQLQALLAAGAIGDVISVQADLGVQAPYDPADRLFDPAQGGGAMLDLGVYVVSFAQSILGVPQTITAHGALAPTGVDRQASMLLGYSDGRSATLTTSLGAPLPGLARVFGSRGWIEVPPRFHHPDRLIIHRRGQADEELVLPPAGAGYSHELTEVNDCLLAGRTESVVMPLADSLAVQRILDEACRQLGVTHAEDPAALD